jgi:putative heme-binding domain-containing protein
VSSVSLFEKPRPLPGQVFWHNFQTQFPPDAVLVKTIALDVLVNGREVRRRVETQLLHCDGEDWFAYTFAWRDDQTDADLVPADGAEKVLRVKPAFAPEETRERVWTFHSRSQCMSCHNSWSEYALAFSPAQLNDGRLVGDERTNHIVDLMEEGFVRRVGEKDQALPPWTEAQAAKQPQLSDTFGGAYSLDERARTYLHVNCAHCHRFGGGGGQVVLELDYARPLKDMGILDARPRQGDFGIPDARIVAPGDPARSVILHRMARFGRGRMPHLGSEQPHPFGVELIDRWIRSLGKRPAPHSLDLPDTAAGHDAALGKLYPAMAFSLAVGDNRLNPADRKTVLAAAAQLPPGPTRDLFEGYFPPDPKGRKIGSNPRSASILAMTGDAKRGEAIFFTESMQCGKCHKVADRGVALGPDLTAIGKTRTRAELLDSVLYPSAKVEPQYAAYLVKTADGRSFTGLLVKRDDKQVILRDAENKEVVLSAGNVEAVQPSRLSLMPDGQVAGLTPQEAADLLEFLSSRK